MKILKITAIVLIVYAAIVTTFESLIGYFQPQDQNTLIITTVDEDGDASDRVLSTIELDDHLYVAANHWPRAWYREALKNPQVRVTMDGEAAPYMAQPVSDEEHERLQAERGLGLVVRILTGFPPRRFVRLEPG